MIVGDIEAAVRRLESTSRDGGVFDRARLATVLDETCAELATRHARPAYLEEHCDELVDQLIGDGLADSQSALVATLVLRNRLSRGGFQPSGALEDRLCGELTDYRFCPRPAAGDAGDDGDDGGAAEDGGEADDAGAAAAAAKTAEDAPPAAEPRDEL